MSIKLFKQDKNYILKKAQSETKNHLLKNLIKKSIIKYELESNPLGLIDSTSVSLKKYEINHESKLNFFYKKISTIYRYNYGEVQLSFLWDGSSHNEFYKNRWIRFFKKETEMIIKATGISPYSTAMVKNPLCEVVISSYCDKEKSDVIDLN